MSAPIQRPLVAIFAALAVVAHLDDVHAGVLVEAEGDGVDDVGFLLAVVDEIQAEYRTDPARGWQCPSTAALRSQFSPSRRTA